uniref:AlNc14C175G8099 protein n=1 Tax=Albugo laibachii Nc14 TaxID=890382 RepID=F0WNT9_9STRA|nr:AlNc14C175G8099 [Albugo laibachii Nc14]|eukprot:CCA22982.1 AlNc14C175G8099 [Albugo laibachii Nc14]
MKIRVIGRYCAELTSNICYSKQPLNTIEEQSMWRSRVCALLLALLVLQCNGTRPSYAHKVRGVLSVGINRDSTFYLCQKCLVQFLGIARTHTLEVRSDIRFLLVEGHSDILRAFVSFCSVPHICTIKAASSLFYDINHFTHAHHQQPQHFYEPDTIEESLFQLAEFEVSTKQVIPFSTNPLYKKHDLSTFIRKQAANVPIFFSKELEKRHIAPGMKSLGEVRERSSSTTFQDQKAIDSSIQCIVIPGMLTFATCRECLAMHSKQFAVRCYFLFHKSRKTSAQLCVLYGKFELTDIVENCNREFCAGMFTWEPQDCQKMDYIFPMHRQMLQAQKTSDTSESELNEARSDENAMDLASLKHIVKTIAFKKIGKPLPKVESSLDAFTYLNTLRMVDPNSYICINITAKQSARWRCIKCVLKSTDGSRLVLLSSLQHSMILTYGNRKAVVCNSCRNIQMLHSPSCADFLQKHVQTIETHEKPSELHLPTTVHAYCIVGYYSPSSKNKCTVCMRNVLSPESKIYAISDVSIMIETQKNEQAFDELFMICHAVKKCARIQQVPHAFCSVHRSQISVDSIQRSLQNGRHIFTEKNTPVGIWPPQTHRFVSKVGKFTSQTKIYPQSELGIGSETLLPYKNIALVYYRHEADGRFDCILCLIEHTEVFFVDSKTASMGGYVWMRQAPSNIFKLCVGKICTSLAYDAHSQQMVRPVGLRQVTRDDIVLDKMMLERKRQRGRRALAR